MDIYHSSGRRVDYFVLDRDICNYFDIPIDVQSFATIPNEGKFSYLSSISWYDILLQAYDEGANTLEEILEYYTKQYTIEGEAEPKDKIPQVFKLVDYLIKNNYKI